MSKKSKYIVGHTRCNCHPETCSCNDYIIYLENGNTYTNPKRIASGMTEETLAELVYLANIGLKVIRKADKKMRLKEKKKS